MDITITIDGQEPIKCELTDHKLISFLKSSNNLKDIFERLLTFGYTILSIPFKSDYTLDGIDKGFTDMKECFQVISDKLEPIQTNGTSCKIGKLAEILGQNNFKKAFPDFTYDDVAKINKTGDAIINTHQALGYFMMEYKNYSTSVSQKEVDKLYRDMDNTNIHYAIMMSFNSSIANKKQFDYEIRGSNCVVFISCGGYDGICIELAVRFLLHLYEVNMLSVYDKSYELASQIKYAEYTKFYEKLFGISSKISQLNTTIIESRDIINKSFDKLSREGVSIESDMNCLLCQVKDFSTDISQGTLGNLLEYEQVNILIDDKLSKPQAMLCKKFMLLIKNRSLDTKIDGLILYFYKETRLLCKIDLSKTKLEVVFENYDSETIRFNKKYEAYRSDKYIIPLKENEDIWKLIKERLSNFIVE